MSIAQGTAKQLGPQDQMPTTHALPPGADPVKWRPELVRQVDRFLFGVEQWVNPRALSSALRKTRAMDSSEAPQASNNVAVDGVALSVHQLRRLVSDMFPSRNICLERLTRDWRSRLALLPLADWMRLGFAVSVLPYCGHVQRSMDGNFRRALREAFGADVGQMLDSYAGTSGEIRFQLPASDWKQADRVAMCGIQAVLGQACGWEDAVKERFLLQLDPEQIKIPASVRGLDEQWLEVACKLTLQNHPWLWS